MVTHRRAEAGSQAAAASLKRDVWGEPRRLLVGFDEPNGAVVKITKELPIVRGAHFASPDDLGIVDIGAVVDPLSVNGMFGRIADDDELAAGEAFEVAQDLRSGEQSGVGEREAWPNDLLDEGGEACQRNGPHQKPSSRPAKKPSQAQMAHRLQDQDVEHAGHGCGVVCRHVPFQHETSEEDRARKEPEARAAILEEPWKGDQRESESHSHVEIPNQGYLALGGGQPIVEGTLHGSSLKAWFPFNVKSAHDFVPVDRFGPEGLPEKMRRHGISFAVHLEGHAEGVAAFS